MVLHYFDLLQLLNFNVVRLISFEMTAVYTLIYFSLVRQYRAVAGDTALCCWLVNIIQVLVIQPDANR